MLAERRGPRPPLGIPAEDPRHNNPHYDQRTGRYIHPEERQCPELAEEFRKAYEARNAAWTEGMRVRCEHGDLSREERHRQQREIADIERRARANELHHERRLIDVETRIAARATQQGGAL